ncbi:hypothetical protein D2L64_25595 [Micromonospora radicis]|uniref:ADP ribosyltransferase domain-containing protein n=1 Tax=Micromonospora radicis TaxID=1894971 RepID=A0A418MN85_9ACTN|nr:hypothetical protein D2L64_25595 [Micromonospora radicis]
MLAERVGERLLLRTARDEPLALRAYLQRLPADPQRQVVLVTAAAGLAGGFPDALAIVCAGSPKPVRLVMLGVFPSTATNVDALRYLVQLLGVPVTAPVTPVVPGVEPGPYWLTSRPGQPEQYESRWPWPTSPDPASPPAPAGIALPDSVEPAQRTVKLPLLAAREVSAERTVLLARPGAPPAPPVPAVPPAPPVPAVPPVSPGVAVPPAPPAPVVPSVPPVPVSATLRALLRPRNWPHAGAWIERPAVPVPPAMPDPPGQDAPHQQLSAPPAPASAVPVTAEMSPDVAEPEALHQPVGPLPPATDPAGAGAAARRTPVWIDNRSWREEDRAVLRTTLNGRYDAHVRVVTKTLAEEPGLRAAGASPDLVAGLVALRAYCADDRNEVNRFLRTGAGEERAAVVARGVAYGLRYLPTVLGPVFRPGRIGVETLAAYRPGRVLAEPGLLDVRIPPTTVADATVQFVIWSVSARRLGRLDVDGTSAALFPPASRFAVLAVDHSNDPADVPRVLLCDIAGAAEGRPAANSERMLNRMRAASQETREQALAEAYVSGAPGLDETGHPYRERESDEP